MTPERVLAEVERVMSRPFEWGPADCWSAACDTFAGLWGFDPMASLRGYRGARAAARILADGGGMAALADRVMTGAGLVAGHATGGLGLAVIEGRGSLLVCIRPGLWAGKSLRGFALLKSAEMGWHYAQTAAYHHGPGRLCRGS